MVIDYNSQYTSLALYVVQSDKDAVIKYVAGLNPEVRYAAIHVAGWTDATKVVEKQALAVQGQRIVDEVTAMGGEGQEVNVSAPKFIQPDSDTYSDCQDTANNSEYPTTNGNRCHFRSNRQEKPLSSYQVYLHPEKFVFLLPSTV